MKYFVAITLFLVLPLVGCGEVAVPEEASIEDTSVLDSGGITHDIDAETLEEGGVVTPDGEVEPSRVEIKSEGAITAIPATYELSDKGSIGFEPGKYTIGNFALGKEADLSVTLHNSRNEPVSFLLSYVTPSYTEEGYEIAPKEAKDWLSFAPTLPELQPQEKKDFVATLHLPEDAEVPPRWEFWIEIKEAGQTDEVQVAGCLRVFVNMR